MIYSGVDDNWTRLTIIHSVAQDYYGATQGTEYRGSIVSGNSPFPFDCLMYDAMTKESCMVGMVMVWAMVTLEALVNHGIAEAFVSDGASTDLVSQIIEKPRQITDKARLEVKSDLARKVYILASRRGLDKEILILADKLSFVRNSIVHDKPFSLINSQDGDVEIEWYNSKDEPKTYRYDDLKWYFDGCDRIIDYIAQFHNIEELAGRKISFAQLLHHSLSCSPVQIPYQV